MRKNFPISFEFIYQLFALILIIIIVHAVYVAVIRPKADAILAEQAAILDEDKSQVTERSVYVLIKDYEQETCFILMFWALAIMAYKSIVTIRHRALLQKDLDTVGGGGANSTRRYPQPVTANSSPAAPAAKCPAPQGTAGSAAPVQ